MRVVPAVGRIGMRSGGRGCGPRCGHLGTSCRRSGSCSGGSLGLKAGSASRLSLRALRFDVWPRLHWGLGCRVRTTNLCGTVVAIGGLVEISLPIELALVVVDGCRQG